VGRYPGQFLRRTELTKRSLRLDDEPKWWCKEPLHWGPSQLAPLRLAVVLDAYPLVSCSVSPRLGDSRRAKQAPSALKDPVRDPNRHHSPPPPPFNTAPMLELPPFLPPPADGRMANDSSLGRLPTCICNLLNGEKSADRGAAASTAANDLHGSTTEATAVGADRVRPCHTYIVSRCFCGCECLNSRIRRQQGGWHPQPNQQMGRWPCVSINSDPQRS